MESEVDTAQSLASDSAMIIPTQSESVAWKTGEFFRRDLPGWLRGWDTSNSPGALSVAVPSLELRNLPPRDIMVISIYWNCLPDCFPTQ